MPGAQTGHIFISYSRRDEVVMRRIVQYLREQGINVWVDNEKLVPGTPIWEREIEKAIDAAYAVVVVLSPDAKESVWVLNELTLADEFRKRVFPVLVRGDFRESVHFRLVTRQYVDLRTNEERGLEALGAALNRYLDELKQIEEKRFAAEREAEQQTQEEAKRLAAQKAEEERIAKAKLEAEHLTEEKRLADEAEKERLVKAKGQRLVHERTVDAERLEKEKAERETAEKAAKEKEQREATEKWLARKNEREGKEKVPLTPEPSFPWQRRMLLGGLVGLFGLFVMSLVPNGYFETTENFYVILSLFVFNSLAGLIAYPHKTSIIILTLGFLTTGTAFSISEPQGADLNFFIGMGCTIGTFLGALVTRTLYWLKFFP